MWKPKRANHMRSEKAISSGSTGIQVADVPGTFIRLPRHCVQSAGDIGRLPHEIPKSPLAVASHQFPAQELNAARRLLFGKPVQQNHTIETDAAQQTNVVIKIEQARTGRQLTRLAVVI